MDAVGEDFSVGKEFSSYAHLSSAIKEYEAANSVEKFKDHSGCSKTCPQPPFFG